MGGARSCAFIGSYACMCRLHELRLINMAGLLRRLVLCEGTRLLVARTICSTTATKAKVAVVSSRIIDGTPLLALVW